MNPKTMLKTARNLFKRGDFGLAIRLLEKEVFHFRSNPDYYLILCLCYLKLNNPKTAQTYLKSACTLNPYSVEVAQAQAILNVMSGKSEKALAYWLEILDKDPHDLVAQNGLDLLRIHSQKPIGAWVNTPDFASMYILPSLEYTRKQIKENKAMRYSVKSKRKPKLKTSFADPLLNVCKGLLIFVSVMLLGLALILIGNWLLQSLKKAILPKRAGIEVISLSPQDTLIDSSQQDYGKTKKQNQYRYTLSSQEVVKLFDMIKDSFNQYEDNTAQMLINRLSLSNAGEEVKKKASSLTQFIIQPSFATFKNGPTYQEVSRDPCLYENVYVLWKGKVTNLKQTEQEYTFDLLVGYTDNKILQGIVLCKMMFDIFLENGMNVELIGQVKEYEELPSFCLRVTSLHNLQP